MDESAQLGDHEAVRASQSSLTWALAPLVVAGLSSGCGGSGEADEPSLPTASSWVWNLPDGYPPPAVPEDNPMTEAKVELGRWLFFDPLLSADGTASCASCHEPARAFTDGRPVSPGITGELTKRNAMSLVNVAYAGTLNWANPDLARLETQALIPLLGTDPIELGNETDVEGLEARIAAADGYPERFAAAFPEDAAPIRLQRIVEALAAFQRSLISFDAPYDRYLAGDATALSDSALRGLALFFGERLECFHCHGGNNFSLASVHASEGFSAGLAFHNTGLYDVDGLGAYPISDQGLIEATGRPVDMGRFKAPTLRNIELTAPYMHDGSIPDLDGVLDHYSRGGTETTSGPNAGDGKDSFLKSGFVSGFRLTPQEREDLKAFLRSLTDSSFIENPAYQDPR